MSRSFALGLGEVEAADGDGEAFAGFGLEFVMAFHGAPVGGEGAVAGVFEAVAGGEAGAVRADREGRVGDALARERPAVQDDDMKSGRVEEPPAHELSQCP